MASRGGGAAGRTLGEMCEALLASGPWNAAHTTTRAGLVKRLNMIEEAGLPRMRVRAPLGQNRDHHTYRWSQPTPTTTTTTPNSGSQVLSNR